MYIDCSRNGHHLMTSKLLSIGNKCITLLPLVWSRFLRRFLHAPCDMFNTAHMVAIAPFPLWRGDLGHFVYIPVTQELYRWTKNSLYIWPLNPLHIANSKHPSSKGTQKMLAACFILASLLIYIGSAAPAPDLKPLQFSESQNITPLNTAQISVFTPFMYFASAAYCNPNTTINWSCGGTCSVSFPCGGDWRSVLYWQQ